MSKLEDLSLGKLKKARRRSVQVGGDELVRTASLHEGSRLPLILEPAVEGVDLVRWAGANRELVERRLEEHGGILFRGFGVASVEQFEGVIRELYGDLLEYSDRVQPRSKVHGNVYTSTEYPPDYWIEMHNESSYAFTWALRILFYCHLPSTTGGATPIADCREIYRRIDPAVRERFRKKKVMYVRNFGGDFGISWKNAFQTEDRAEMEAFCQRTGVEIEWREGGLLRTRSVRPMALRHPHTDEEVWFNAAVSSHISTVEESVRETLLAELAEDELPKNSFYGDGTPIEPEVLTELRRAYREAMVSFPWQKGDVLLLDNMLTAHGRAPYSGPRKVLVGMAMPVSLDQMRPA